MPKCRKLSVADKYYGAVKVEKWPEDLDEYAAKLIAENEIKLKEASTKQR